MCACTKQTPGKKFQILLPVLGGEAVGVLQKCVAVPKNQSTPKPRCKKHVNVPKNHTTSFWGGGKCMSGSSVCKICFLFFVFLVRSRVFCTSVWRFFGFLVQSRVFCTSVWRLFGFFSTVTHCLHHGLEVAWFFRYSHAFVAPPSGSVFVLLACLYNSTLAATGIISLF